jgi:hypothetical protein
MGDWGPEPLSNDPAQDFLMEVLQARGGWALVRKALSRIGPYADDEQGRAALAAAELVAAALGDPSPLLDDEDRTFAASMRSGDGMALRNLALAAIEQIRTKSDLRSLWEEGDGPHDWLTAIDELARRLKVNRGS